MGKILGTAFTVFEKKNSVNTQSYGPESRGGACRSEVVVSGREINYPYVRNADVFIALSQAAMDKYISGLKKGGILILDPDSVEKVPDRDSYRVYEVPAMEIADQNGGIKFQNSVALGALFQLIRNQLSENSLRKAICENVPKNTIRENLKAFEKGMAHIGLDYYKNGKNRS